MKNKKAVLYYYKAKSYVYEQGYYFETFYYEQIKPEKISHSEFYREYTWVVLSSGMSEKVILSVFSKIAFLFKEWVDIDYILKNKEQIRNQALRLFNNKQKIDAIISMADYLRNTTVLSEIVQIEKYGIEYLMRFKFLGPATAYHFAKNLGLNVMKPDRHLVRISNLFGYTDPHSFCDNISLITGERKALIDLILWRYATLNKSYLNQSHG